MRRELAPWDEEWSRRLPLGSTRRKKRRSVVATTCRLNRAWKRQETASVQNEGIRRCTPIRATATWRTRDESRKRVKDGGKSTTAKRCAAEQPAMRRDGGRRTTRPGYGTAPRGGETGEREGPQGSPNGGDARHDAREKQRRAKQRPSSKGAEGRGAGAARKRSGQRWAG